MSIPNNIKEIQERIHQTELDSHRPLNSVQLLAVSKQRSSSEILQAYEAGITNFGENYLQEALPKMATLSNLPLQWHFIGSIQRNKTTVIAQHFNWVHTVSSELVATRLSRARPDDNDPLNCCIQVNLDREKTKSGIDQEEVLPLAQFISNLPRIKLRGLMAIPKPEHSFEMQFESFQRLTLLLTQVNEHLEIKMDSLSMGMSADYVSAIKAGSTMIRIGTLIFGDRQRKFLG